MPVYSMNTFKLPKKICEEIESVLAQFWWNGAFDTKRMHWMSWKRLCGNKKEGGIGFRDIEVFNIALLAKQIWRIMLNPHSLVARTLKGRYFSRNTILQATKGTQASYGWQSLLHGRDLIKKGIRHVVGDGTSINAWHDQWLDLQPSRAPRRTTSAREDVECVCDLISPTTKDWDVTKIEEVIHPDDVELVLDLKLPHTQCKDLIVWNYTKDGIYSVKSGYWLGMSSNEAQLLPPPDNIDVKAKIWRLPLPPKIKIFLWKLCSCAVATGEELRRRHIVGDARCKRCLVEIETTSHLMFTCLHSKKVWEEANTPLFQQIKAANDFGDQMRILLEEERNTALSTPQQPIPFWIMWWLWKERNDKVFNNKSMNWRKVLRLAKEEGEEWSNLHDKTVSSSKRTISTSRQRQNVAWQRPRRNLVKCNYDGSFIGAQEKEPAAWVIRDDNGNFVFAGSATGLKVSTPLEAEFQALVMAFQNLWIKGFRRVIMEGDCQSLLNIIRGKSHNTRSINWIREVTSWMTRFQEVEFLWTSRTNNLPADHLAKKQRQRRENLSVFTNVPVCIENVVNYDRIRSV